MRHEISMTASALMASFGEVTMVSRSMLYIALMKPPYFIWVKGFPHAIPIRSSVLRMTFGLYGLEAPRSSMQILPVNFDSQIWKDFLQSRNIQFDLTTEAWQGRSVVRHGGIIKEMLNRYGQDRPIQSVRNH